MRCIDDTGFSVSCTAPIIQNVDPFWPTVGWAIFGLVLLAIALVVAWMVYGPRYGVYRQRLQGQADLAEAEFESRVRVQRALAEEDAAAHEARADITRAKGIAASIDEVESKLGGPEGYLRWKYIHMLEENANIETVVYVPTEAGLPILEAGKGRN